MGSKKSKYSKRKQREESAMDDTSSDSTPPPVEDLPSLADDDLDADDAGSTDAAPPEPKSKASKHHGKNAKADIEDNESMDGKERTTRSMFFCAFDLTIVDLTCSIRNCPSSSSRQVRLHTAHFC